MADIPAETKKKILVAEDERPMAQALNLKLTSAGFDVKVAYNGEEALKLIDCEKFDLIILDIIMPKMDGFSVLKTLKERNNVTPVIAATNLGQEEDIKRVNELGVKNYFVKSNTPLSVLVQTIKDVLHL